MCCDVNVNVVPAEQDSSFGGVKGEKVRGGEGGDDVCACVCVSFLHAPVHTPTLRIH